MTIKRVISGGKFPVKVWTDEIEGTAEAQLRDLSELPFIHKHIAVMPDVHAGIGSTVGTVIPTKGAIIPAAVGVDIGCGMMAIHTTLRAEDLPDSLGGVRSAIEASVPHGFVTNPYARHIKGSFSDFTQVDAGEWMNLEHRLYGITDKHQKFSERNGVEKAALQLGSLGGGNHFIELCVDKQDGVWVMLHSGSRGIGNKIGTYFIELAREDMRRHFINLPHRDLAYFPEGTEHFNDYVEAMLWAQDYARTNREVMMRAVLGAVRDTVAQPFGVAKMAVNCHHNYCERENHYGENVWVTRKGAVRARSGDLGIIPGSMGARSFIVRGLGNADSFNSCSHGAGRRMSRTAARAAFSVEDLKTQTAGVECRKDDGVIDEIPGAYKDIDTVMAHQSDLVEIVAELRQVLCVKG